MDIVPTCTLTYACVCLISLVLRYNIDLHEEKNSDNCDRGWLEFGAEPMPQLIEGVWLNVDYTIFALPVYNIQTNFEEIYIYTFYTTSFEKNAKIYNLHLKKGKICNFFYLISKSNLQIYTSNKSSVYNLHTERS